METAHFPIFHFFFVSVSIMNGILNYEFRRRNTRSTRAMYLLSALEINRIFNFQHVVCVCVTSRRIGTP